MEQGARYFYVSLSEKKKTLIAFGRRLAEPSLSKQANAAKRVVFALVLVNILEQFSVPRKDSHGRPREGSTPSSHLRKKKGGKKIEKNVNLVEVSLIGT